MDLQILGGTKKLGAYHVGLNFSTSYIHHQFTKISNSKAIPNKWIKYLKNIGIVGSKNDLLTYYY
jgi:hypothetical protein